MKRKKQSTLTNTLLAIMSVSAGLTAASVYYIYPMLPGLAGSIGISPVWAGLAVALMLVGFSVGILLIMPAGSMLERKRLLITMLIITVFGLLLCGYAETYGELLGGVLVMSAFSASAYLIPSYAAAIALPDDRERVLSIAMTGLMTGVLLSRMVSGVLSDIGGWQTVYLASAGVMGLCIILMGVMLPTHPATMHVHYPSLIKSIFKSFADNRQFRLRAILGALANGLFFALWSVLSFMLKDAYGYSDTVIGLFGLAGVVGIVGAYHLGRASFVENNRNYTTIAIVMAALSWGLILPGFQSIFILIAGIVILDLAVQIINLMNLNVILGIEPGSATRLSAGYLSVCFAGAAAGSVLAILIYTYVGWSGVCIAGSVVALAMMGIWLMCHCKAHSES